ncbi:hypothetical protein PoB_000110200 [Plakobranchus ocellatus]|uniref:Uncharacterized protein n=1 Tax=Plakobranchus ocellatus TaxID=259542 RepID=A0AAV3XVW6_9GAST|nr:hypothetical protein PoB_000110200 [Plakobranchus ocellatus]
MPYAKEQSEPYSTFPDVWTKHGTHSILLLLYIMFDSCNLSLPHLSNEKKVFTILVLSTDWHDIFQQFDPRKPFEPELCTKCISLVTVLDCGASVYLINKDEAAMNQLMLFLHDGSCACKCSGKRRFYFSLLDVIAASGSMEGLRACVAFIQDHLDTTRSAISVGCRIKEIKRRLDCEFPKLDFENADDRNPPCFPFSSTEGGVQKRLLSPNCDGQYEERRTFQREPSSFLENEPIHPHHCFENDDATPLSHSQNSNADRAEHDLPGETLGATCSDHAHYHGPSEAYPRRSVVHPESLHATKEHHPVFQSSDVNTKPWSRLFCSTCSCTNATADISAGSTAPPKPDGKKYYSGCCSSKTDVDCLRQHLDQVSLLSMSAQALYYNNVEMMVCAGALTPISIAELVRMTGNIPLTSALPALANERHEQQNTGAKS